MKVVTATAMLRGIILCVAAIVSPALAQEPVESTDASREKYLRALGDKHPQPGRRYHSINLAKAMSEQELDWYADILRLSDAQRHFLAQMFTLYRMDDNDVRITEVSALWQQSGEIIDTIAPDDPRIGEAMTLLWDARAKVEKQLLAVEGNLWNQLLEVLSENQVSQLERVRLIRRRVHANAYHCPGPGAMIDLEALLRKLKENRIDVTPTDVEAFDAAILEYSRTATTLFEKRTALRLKAGPENMRLSAELQSLGRPEDPDSLALAEDIRAESRRAMEKQLALATQIHDLNRRVLVQLSSLLPAEAGKELTAAFNKSAYPDVFPNPYDMDELFTTALATSDLTHDQLDALQVIQSNHRSEVEAINEQMRLRYVDWKENWFRNSGYLHVDFDQYQREMRRMQIQRQVSAQVAIDEIKSIFSSQQANALQNSIAGLEARINRDKEDLQATVDASLRQWPMP